MMRRQGLVKTSLKALVVALVLAPLAFGSPQGVPPAAADHHIVSWYPGGYSNGCGDSWCDPCRPLCYCCGCPAPGSCLEDP